MPPVPLGVKSSLLSVFLLPLSTLKAVSRNESLHDEHVAGVVALTAQTQLVRPGNKP